ncbi:OmpA family protein, partial [bacterium]|nr:OmpA family protein [bacterium]
EAESIQVLDDDQTGYQLTLGVDLSDWFSVELHGADLGEAEFTGGGTIRYREYGLSGLVYLGGARSRFNRHGWTAFGRTGVGYLSTSAGGGLESNQDNEVSLILGLGAEFSTLSGFGLRVEGIAFNEDASYLQLGLIYRLGRALAWMGGKPDVEANDDRCPDTASGIAVGDNGCAVVNGVINGLTFQSGSAVLTPGARVVLDNIAASLRQQPDARALVSAHTDSQGNADSNLQLSKLRAFEVAKYLVQSGVAKARLEARAFGEIRPIDTNSTEQGRNNNRRVEIVLIDE